jgi:hypothetical protein
LSECVVFEIISILCIELASIEACWLTRGLLRGHRISSRPMLLLVYNHMVLISIFYIPLVHIGASMLWAKLELVPAQLERKTF